MSLSTTEAEYQATTMVAQESIWLIWLLRDLCQPTKVAITLYCDNQSVIHFAENPVFHARTKHIKMHHHFIREKVLQEKIELKHIKTNDQVANLFTKSLSGNKFESFCCQLGMIKREEAGIEMRCFHGHSR